MRKPKPEKPGETIRFSQNFSSIDRLARWLEFYDAKGFDCYFAVAGFKKAIVFDPVPNEKGYHERHLRAAINEPVLIGFHGEIDTKVTHAKTATYEHPEDAARHLVEFCRAYNLPIPLWVMSGGGIHFYWQLLALLEAAEWKILARGLKHTMLAFGLDIGKERAADASSIMRVPGLHNWKNGRLVEVGGELPVVNVEVFEQFREKGLENNAARVHQLPLRDSPIARAMASGVLDDPSSMALVGQRCGQIKLYAGSPGDFGETFSRGVAGLARVAGEAGWGEYIGWIAPEYHELARQKAAGWNASATTCAYFREHGPKSSPCEACPVKDEIKSPIILGRQDFDWPEAQAGAAAQAADVQPAISPPQESITVEPTGSVKSWRDDMNGCPVLPSKFHWGPDGELMFGKENRRTGEDDSRMVAGNPIYMESLQEGESTGQAIVTIKHRHPQTGWRDITFPQSFFNDNKFSGELLNRGVWIGDSAALKEYLQDQGKQLSAKAKTGMRYEQSGWKFVNGVWQFVHGPNLILPDGEVRAAIISEDLGNRVRKGLMPAFGGSAREFVATLHEAFAPDHYAAWFGVLTGLSSPFMLFYDAAAGGLFLIFVGPTGDGKSMIMRAALSIWSHWDAATILPNDTAAAMGLILAGAGNLPIGFDEVHDLLSDKLHGPTKFRTFVDMLVQGSDKHRATQFGAGLRAQMLRFCMNPLGTSNVSPSDMIEATATEADGTAKRMRLAEMSAVAPKPFDPTKGDRFKHGFNNNAGHCGFEFMKIVMREGWLPGIQKDLAANKEKIWKQSGFGIPQRYRINCISGNATLGPIAKHLGIIPKAVDLDAVQQWALEQVRMKSPDESYRPSVHTVTRAINSYFSENLQFTLRVQFAYKPGVTQLPLGLHRPQKLRIRVETNTAKAYTGIRELKSWLVQNGYSADDVIAIAKQEGIISNARCWATLGAGTEYQSSQIPAVEFNLTHPIFLDPIHRIPGEGTAASAPGP